MLYHTIYRSQSIHSLDPPSVLEFFPVRKQGSIHLVQTHNHIALLKYFAWHSNGGLSFFAEKSFRNSDLSALLRFGR